MSFKASSGRQAPLTWTTAVLLLLLLLACSSAHAQHRTRVPRSAHSSLPGTNHPHDALPGTRFPNEFAGPLDGGNRLLCIDYFVLRMEVLECVTLGSHVDGVRGELCSLPGNQYLLAIHSQPRSRDLFTARIIGPQVVMLPLTSCHITNRKETTGHQSGCDTREPVHRPVMYGLLSGLLPGKYSLDVMLLYQDFSFGKNMIRINANMTNLHAINFNVIVADNKGGSSNLGPAGTLGTGTAVQGSLGGAALATAVQGLGDHEEEGACEYCERATWPVCNASYLEGTWISGTNGTTLPLGLKMSHNPDQLQWQPRGCNLVPTASIDLKQCVLDEKKEEKKHVCFVGDSQTRHVSNGVVGAIENSGLRTADTTVKDVMTSDHVTYIVFNGVLEEDKWVDSRLDKCTHVFFNFGQWPLSHIVYSRWSASHYTAALVILLSQIKAYQKNHTTTQFYWMSTNAHDIIFKHQTCQADSGDGMGLDFRTHPFLESFNVVAKKIMDRHKMRTVDIFGLSAPLYDMSYDGPHYHPKGSVGHYITELLANIVCVQR